MIVLCINAIVVGLETDKRQTVAEESNILNQLEVLNYDVNNSSPRNKTGYCNNL